MIPNPILVTIDDRSRIFRTTIRSAIVKRDSKFCRYHESLLLFSARLESTIPYSCIPDRHDAHYLICSCMILTVCRSILPVFSRSNKILSISHNENRFFESRITVHRASLVCLDRTFVSFSTTTPLFVRFSVSFGRGRMLQSTRDSSIATVQHSSIDPSDPSTHDSSVVS